MACWRSHTDDGMKLECEYKSQPESNKPAAPQQNSSGVE